MDLDECVKELYALQMLHAAKVDRIAALEKELKQANKFVRGWEEEAKGLKRDIIRLKSLLDAKNEDYWAWQGDDEDHLESLVCPVVIYADDLRDIIAKGDRAEKELAEAKEIIGKFKFALVGIDGDSALERLEEVVARGATLEQELKKARGTTAEQK